MDVAMDSDRGRLIGAFLWILRPKFVRDYDLYISHIVSHESAADPVLA